jgi:tetratricopeptide (TPR) repeat protein
MNAAQIATAALIHLGLIDSLHGVHPRSTERYRKAIVLAQQMGDHAQEGTASMLLGDELSKAKQPQQSVSHYQRALEIAKQMGLQSRQKLLLTKLGEVLASKDSSSATKALQEASQLEQQIETQHQVELQLAQRMGAHHREVEILNALARQSHHKKDYAQAIEYAERSQEIAQRINDPLGEYGALKILGDIYGVLKQPQQELEYYQQCLVTAQRAGEPQLEAFTWKYLGFILIRVSDTSSAIRCLQSAHDLFKSLRLEEEATLVNKEIKALKKP